MKIYSVAKLIGSCMIQAWLDPGAQKKSLDQVSFHFFFVSLCLDSFSYRHPWTPILGLHPRGKKLYFFPINCDKSQEDTSLWPSWSTPASSITVQQDGTPHRCGPVAQAGEVMPLLPKGK